VEHIATVDDSVDIAIDRFVYDLGERVCKIVGALLQVILMVPEVGI
jgi:hypothetical protein